MFKISPEIRHRLALELRPPIARRERFSFVLVGKPSDLLEVSIPKIENIHQKIYAAASAKDALNMADIHTCETTHCRAGWVVHLAGEAGYALQSRFNWELAAMLIYRESGSPINPARFYDSNEDALSNMKSLAEAEVAP